MFVVINRIRPLPGTEDRIEQAFARASGMKGVPGCLGFEFWRSREGGEYLVVTRWDSEESFRAWRESEHFRRAHRDTSASAGASSELLVYEVLRSV
ncbi:MAG: antibiotic biosynthesis monooxygenase [Symbiobacteriaceae bacterium]|nr:MAG: antibiotic biosynthesis monooxygenase [Bacillota bacterium]